MVEPTKENLFAVAVKAGLNEKEVVYEFERICTIMNGV